MIGETVSHYRIVRRLGGGGMGVVYLAEDLSLDGREVAIKVLRPDVVAEREHRTRFLREAKAVAALQHPHLCEIHEIGERQDGSLFLVMAYYRGGTLRDRMRAGPLSPDQAFPIALAAARGLAHAHAQGIFHRDIKPENLVFTEDGYLKIVDFGLARLAGSTHFTTSGGLIGTAAYMSPEQARSHETDARTDVWSLGVALHEMLAGERPFQGDSVGALLYAIERSTPAPLPETVGAGRSLVERCLRKRGDERFADAAELTHELETLIRTQGWDSSRHSPASIPAAEHPGGASPPADTSPIPGGRRGRWIGAGVALAVLVALLWWRAPHDDSPGFVTDVRAAVLPITDRTDSQWSSLAAGLTTVLTEALEDCARQVTSMWVAPLRHVEYADPAGPAEAQEALGVNRVVSGNLQTFGDGLRLSLAGFFPGGRERPRVTTIDFSPEDPSKLRAEIPAFLAQTIPAAGQASIPEILPAGAAAAAYLRGVGSLPADPAGAVRELRLATEQAPDFTPARGRLGLAWLRLFDATGDSAALVHSLETLRSLRDEGSAGPTHLEWLGDAYERLGAPDSAVASYRAALALDPGRSYAAREIARALRKSSRFDEGTAVLRTVIAREPDYFANHRDLAAHFYRSGLPDSAAPEFERSLALAPRDNFSLNALGAIHYAAGHWAEARSFFERSFRLVPSYDACSNVGAMYYYEGDFENSARYYEIALAYADSTNPNTWGNLAKSLHWIPGQHAACDSLLRRAIRLVKARTAEDPSDVEGLVNLVDFQAMLGDSTAALALLPEVSRRAGDDGNRRYRLGCAWEMLGERENALQELFRALRLGVPLWVLEGTPELADLRTDARFADFVGGSEDAGH